MMGDEEPPESGPGLVKILGGSACCLILLLTSLVWMVFASIEPTQYGLQYNWWTQQVSDNKGSAFLAGRYFVGFTSSFIVFPGTVQTIEWSSHTRSSDSSTHFRSLKSRTADGLAIELECSVQYQLMPRSTLDLYHTFALDFEKVFAEVAASVIMTEATNYEAKEFFANRTQIAPLMQETITRVFADKLHATMQLFQLLTVGLPSQFEDAVHETQMKRQNITIFESQRQRLEVEWQTELMKAQQFVGVKVNQANAVAEKLKLEARAQGQREVLHAQGDAAARLVKQRATANATLLQKAADADAILATKTTDALTIRMNSETEFNGSNLSHYLTSVSYGKVMKSLKDEELFLELVQVVALQNVSWKKMTVNAGAENDPLAYMGLAPIKSVSAVSAPSQ